MSIYPGKRETMIDFVSPLALFLNVSGNLILSVIIYLTPSETFFMDFFQ